MRRSCTVARPAFGLRALASGMGGCAVSCARRAAVAWVACITRSGGGLGLGGTSCWAALPTLPG
eukprot:11448812-Alexandrium_andersonii.AAC.1